MPYAATDNLDDMDATKPLGTDSPADLDDADRETRLVMKNVIKNAHTKKGAIRVAIWKQVITAALSSGTNTQWNRRALATLVDPSALIGAGDWTNSIKPIAGTYAVEFWSCGYKLDGFMARFAQAISNSAVTEIAALLGNMAFANNVEAEMIKSMGGDILVTDGTKSYCLEQRHTVNNLTDGYGRAATTGWTTATNGTNPVAYVKLTLLSIAAIP